ncbi:MAG: ABC transporter permease [Bacteroidia bacterium]|nr:ABC transporter permease [Bacteroidia bacterium]
MKQVFVFVRKEFYHVFRDRKTLLLLFGLPVMQIVLFGFALSNEIKKADIAICDYAHDATSQKIVQALNAGTVFQTREVLFSHREIESTLRRSDEKLVIVIPAGFSDDLYHQHKAQIGIIADAEDPNLANALIAYAARIIADVQSRVIPPSSLPMQIIPEIRMIYNPELKGATNFVPGVMALVLLLVCVLMTSVSIVREKETGTMEVLLVSPLHPVLFIVAKAIPYFLLSLLNLTVILVLSVFLLDMPVNGSILLLYAESALLIITALALGLVFSNITSSQQTAMLISLLGMLLPTVIFSGFMFPVENMPVPLQVLSNIFPSKWYYIIVKGIMIKGLGFAELWKETMILTGMAMLFLIISFKSFNIRMA